MTTDSILWLPLRGHRDYNRVRWKLKLILRRRNRSPVIFSPTQEAQLRDCLLHLMQAIAGTKKKLIYMKSLVDALPPIQKLNIIRNILPEDGPFPNNALLPLLLYKEAFQITDRQDTETIKEILETNSWTNSWVDGILTEHHYHSTAHEVLVALKGSARVQFGGPNGITLMFEKGDVVIIPAGVAHRNADESNGFSCLGAYPDGQEYDMNFGRPGEKQVADENIKKVALPENDPLYGSDGPLIKNWAVEKGRDTVSL